MSLKGLFAVANYYLIKYNFDKDHTRNKLAQVAVNPALKKPQTYQEQKLEEEAIIQSLSPMIESGVHGIKSNLPIGLEITRPTINTIKNTIKDYDPTQDQLKAERIKSKLDEIWNAYENKRKSLEPIQKQLINLKNKANMMASSMPQAMQTARQINEFIKNVSLQRVSTAEINNKLNYFNNVLIKLEQDKRYYPTQI